MNQTEIKLKREAIQKNGWALKSQLAALQQACTHHDASHVNKANTGNYDPSCVFYWTEHHCPDCDMRW